MNTVENFTIYLQLTYYRCVGNCNNLNDLSNNVCVSNKTRFESKCVQDDYRSK